MGSIDKGNGTTSRAKIFTAAHEINNPLGAIMLIAQNALEQKNGPNPRKLLERTCNKVISHAERCAHIIKEMLQSSRQRKSKKKTGDLNAIVQYAVELTCELRGKDFTKPYLNLADGLPSVLVNSAEIEQVLVNLIKNAYEAGSREVTVSTYLKKSRVELCVEDKGCGISPEALKHIFDPFYTTRIEEGGTGLGLTIIHGIVDDHGGTINVVSAIGKGTKIIIRFLSVKNTVQNNARDNGLTKTAVLAYG